MVQKILNVVNVLTGMRKTVVMLGLMLIAMIFRIKGYINGDNMVDLLKGTCIAFFSVNGIEHMTSTMKEYINSKGQKVDETVVDVTEK